MQSLNGGCNRDARSLTLDDPLIGRLRVTEAGPETVEAENEGKGRLRIPSGAVARINDDQSATKKPKGRKP